MNDLFNIVTNFQIINEIKYGSKYFRVNLGIASTLESNKGESRVLNDKDQFAYTYNLQYKTTIYAQGNIGNIKFYTDHYIKENVLAVYYNLEEFIVPYDRNLVKEKGVDAMIGNLLKSVKEQYEKRIDDIKDKQEQESQNINRGNADIININPGAVTYEDLKAYYQKVKGKI